MYNQSTEHFRETTTTSLDYAYTRLFRGSLDMLQGRLSPASAVEHRIAAVFAAASQDGLVVGAVKVAVADGLLY